MVTGYRAARCKIANYARDHGVPHFHIEGPDFRCSITIASGEVIIGHAPAQVLREAQVWATTNRAAVMQKWLELIG